MKFGGKIHSQLMAHSCHCCLETKSPLNSTFTNMHQVNQYLLDAHDFPQGHRSLLCPPHMLSPLSDWLLPHLPPSLREGISLWVPCILLQRPLGPDRAAAASPRMGREDKRYLNTYCVPATTVDSTANGAIVTSSAYEETEPQKNSLFTQDHRVHA